MEEMVTTAVDTQPDVSTVTAEDTHSEGLEVKYNKQHHTLSREEATHYAQMGMKYESVEPLLSTLKTVAEREGKTLKDWVHGVSERPSDAAETDALTQRMAEEYAVLKREVPDVAEFPALPPDAVRMAAEEGIPLLDAYLRFEHRERRRIAAEREAQAAAAAAGVGTQADGAAPALSAVETAMMKGIWG